MYCQPPTPERGISIAFQAGRAFRGANDILRLSVIIVGASHQASHQLYQCTRETQANARFCTQRSKYQEDHTALVGPVVTIETEA